MLWLGFLPFALWADCGWAVVPVEAVVAFLLLGIEEIGVQIEVRCTKAAHRVQCDAFG